MQDFTALAQTMGSLSAQNQQLAHMIAEQSETIRTLGTLSRNPELSFLRPPLFAALIGASVPRLELHAQQTRTRT